MKKAIWAIGIVGIAWAANVTLVYERMRATPADFNRFMSGVPMPAMMAVPFETLWSRARAGALSSGDLAPDFDLAMHHGSQRVRLSELRGVRPVLLIFGSYT